MKTNKLFKIMLMLAALMVPIILNGCKDEKGINEPNMNEFASQAYAVYDIEDAMAGIVDPSIDKTAGYEDNFSDGKKFRNDFSEGRHGRHLFRILRQLNLSDDQKTAVRGYMNEFKTCMQAPVQTFRQAVQPYLQAANEQRHIIIQRLQNGEITREEARALLQALAQQTRELINVDPTVIAAREDMCECKIGLLDDIATILTTQQLEIWNQWLATLQGPCFEG